MKQPGGDVEVERFAAEIAPKGKGYLAVRRCPPDELAHVLEREAGALFSAGARRVYAASTDPGAPLHEGKLGWCRLTHVHDMLLLRRELGEARPGPGGLAVLEPLRPAEGEAWLKIHNEGFFDVPNSATYGPEELETCLDEDHDCGFFLFEGKAVGVYELALAGQEPEIEGIALRPGFRGRGLGRELLLSAMDRLAELGFQSCFLRVASSNMPALRLYRESGFAEEQIHSKWFEVTVEHG